MVKLVLIAMLLILVHHQAIGQNCTKGMERMMDGKVAKIMTIGNSGRKFPENKGKDLKKYCSENKSYAKEIEEYKNRCMTGLPKQVAAVLIYTLKGSIRQLCNKDSKRLDELIASTTCINTATPEINRCYTDLIDSILGAAHAPHNKKIPHICCEYYRIFPCIESRTKRISVCTEKHVETSMNFVRSILGSVIDLVCTDYTEGSDKCVTLGRPPKKLKSQRRTKSFMLPLVEIFSTFPEV